MSEYILNLLPTTQDEQAEFSSIVPHDTMIFARRSTLTDEHRENATIVMGWPRPEDVARMPKLKWVHSMWAGVDDLLAPDILTEGVMLSSSAGTNSQSVSEHMLACLMSLCRKLYLSRDTQKSHSWTDVPTVRSIAGATVLIVGAGNVGQAFARLCQALGAHTVGLRRTVGDCPQGMDSIHSIDDLDAWLPKVDVVALTLPHSAQTIGLMDARRLGLMKQGSILISAGRGSVLNQDALISALESDHLWGAALDVTTPEPLPADHPLWDAPNLIITPHVAGGMRLELTRTNCISLAQDNLRRYLAHEKLRNQVL